MTNKRKNMKKTILLFATFVFLTIQNHAQTVTDIDGNIYNIVSIGTQKWMKENLKTIHYNNGDEIPNITDSTQWKNLLTGAYCNYNNDTSIAAIYGRLYNWYAATDNRKICPSGWHIPADSECYVLTYYLGSIWNAGGKMKEIGTLHWLSPNIGATNSSDFMALPGGCRNGRNVQPLIDGAFVFLTQYFNMWTTVPIYDSIVQNMDSVAFTRTLRNNDSSILRYLYTKSYGLSVRCICDSATNRINEYKNENDFNLFPNPSTGMIIIEFNQPEKQDLLIEVINILGQKVRIINNKKPTANNNMVVINVSDLAHGVYFIKIRIADGFVVKKFIKE
jgi:uncharacterized protein (TIGR02145 family)